MSELRFILALLIISALTIDLSQAVAANATVGAAEQLYSNQPSVAPELSSVGNYTVGVQTITVVNPDQLSANDFSSREDRPLTLEVWYPAKNAGSKAPTSYKNVTRSGKAFNLQGNAYRDLAPVGLSIPSSESSAEKASDNFPLVVISHGFTGYRTLMFYLAEHLASHGYVVAAIDHTDSTNAEIELVKNSGGGFPSTLINRARDQQFVLDYFAVDKSPLSEIIDTNSAAVIGYSMGGYGALNTVGACYNFTAKKLQRFGMPAATANLPIFNSCNAGRDTTDPRWQAMMAFAPWGGEHDIHSPDSLAKIEIPTLFVAGGEDDVSGYENGVRKLFSQTGSKDKYLMVYQNARHNIAAHPAPKVAYGSDRDIGHHYEPSWKIETINRVNMHMGLAFLNCHIKDIAAACDYLPTRENITQVKQSDRSLSKAWPGFKERWGTGINFYRSNKIFE